MVAGKSLTDNFISRIYRIVAKPRSKALQTDVKTAIFVADFPLDPCFSVSVFLSELLVGIKPISRFQIVYQFRPVSKSRGLVVVASEYVYFL